MTTKSTLRATLAATEAEEASYSGLLLPHNDNEGHPDSIFTRRQRPKKPHTRASYFRTMTTKGTLTASLRGDRDRPKLYPICDNRCTYFNETGQRLTQSITSKLTSFDINDVSYLRVGN